MFPLLAAGGLGAVFTSAMRYALVTYAGSMAVRVLTTLGISFATNELVLDPILDMVRAHISDTPANLLEWMDFFGFDNVLSIFATGALLAVTKRAFLSKRGAP